MKLFKVDTSTYEKKSGLKNFLDELTGQHEQKSLLRMPMKADLKSLVIVAL